MAVKQSKFPESRRTSWSSLIRVRFLLALRRLNELSSTAMTTTMTFAADVTNQPRPKASTHSHTCSVSREGGNAGHVLSVLT